MLFLIMMLLILNPSQCTATTESFYQQQTHIPLYDFSSLSLSGFFISTSNSTDWTQHPGLPFALNMEANIDGWFHVYWFKSYWHISIYISLIYLLVIFSGKRLMKNRSAYSLRGNQLSLTLKNRKNK